MDPSASTIFDTTPEQRGTIRATLYRQLFVTPPPVEGIDLAGKVAIVTGSNGGIGLECARQLLALGLSRLILAVRNEPRGQDARTLLLSELRTRPSPAVIDVWNVDLLSYDSIVSFAERATRTVDRLDIAVLNAGILTQTFRKADAHYSSSPANDDDDGNNGGHEEAMQVNVISNTLLSVLLLPALKPKLPTDTPGRLAVVSSDVASFAKFKERDSSPLLAGLDNSQTFEGWDRYCTSKLLSQLAMTQLARRVDPSEVIITLPNPGLVYGTSLGHLGYPNIRDGIGSVLKRIFGRHPSVGTRTIIAGVTRSGPEAHGKYVEDGKLQPLPPIAYTAEGTRIAETLWDELMQELSFANIKGVLGGEAL